ncbi:hypothetical protein VY88_20015 [Azospirillum thiophilum]|uniref:Uncharacterized protein n=1 Tax=Azospirillum thiophilum TaxID=528244 RepID=A0AAC9EYD4_9PROT|nr:hypothetical protein [Azospirillum thiophilum]ALG74379.1 hypothetical protein AL072_25955 [Azospirillum thiophilum]KJR63752.1 hypothetical protein VY88_20015 [Azospirillum thiophilum]
MQILKALVVIMGVLIIAGFAFLGVELYKRMSDPARAISSASSGETDRSGERGADRTVDVTLDVPAGARIGEMLAVGNRVLFKVTLPQGPDRLYLMDPRSGAVTATITAGRPAQ